MEVLAEAVGEVTVHYLLPMLLDRLVDRRKGPALSPGRPTIAPSEGSGAMRLVASRGGVEVMSRTPGRVRVRVAGLRGDPRLAGLLVEVLSGRPGVCATQASPITGTVLVRFEAQRVSVDRILRVLANVLAVRRVTAHFVPDDPTEVGLALVGT